VAREQIDRESELHSMHFEPADRTQVITKWETTLDQSYKDIHKVLVESVQPALERAILLIDEVEGLAQT